MGGEGPAIRFSQDATATAFWANRTGLKSLSEEELEAGYNRAKDFLLQLGKVLIDDHGWREEQDPTAVLLLTSDKEYTYKTVERRLLLPSSFTSFLDTSKMETWNNMFEFGRIFDAKRSTRSSVDFFIDSMPPLSDIFYLLQTFLPGMLLIYRIDDIDDIGEEETVRALPRAAWVEQHKDLLQMIFGDKRYDCLLAAAGDHSKGYNVKMISSYWSYSDDDRDDDDYYTNSYGLRAQRDYQACDSDCGYCGTCEY